MLHLQDKISEAFIFVYLLIIVQGRCLTRRGAEIWLLSIEVSIILLVIVIVVAVVVVVIIIMFKCNVMTLSFAKALNE